jgi:membrane protease YdiL (CAAX protease family)
MERLGETLQSNGMVISLTTIATFLVCSPLIVVVVRLKKNSNIKQYLGLHAISLKTAILWSLVIVIVTFSFSLVVYGFDIKTNLEFLFKAYRSMKSPWPLWLAIVIAAPVFEELFFRGFLYTGFAKSFIGPYGAVFLTTLVFAVIHIQYDLLGMTMVFVVGLILGFARLLSGSVLLTIGLHSLYNMIALAMVAIHVSD